MRRDSGVAGRRVHSVREAIPLPPSPARPQTPGWLVVHHLDAGERECIFWERHASKLTKAERHAIVHDDLGILTRPLEPAWEEGTELAVAVNMSVVVGPTRFRKGRADYRIAFEVIRDFRARHPRRVPPVHAYDRDHLDSFGMPPEPTPTEIEEARVLGASTTSKRMAVPGHDTAENVEAEDYRVIQMQSHQRAETRREQERLYREQRSLEARVGIARKVAEIKGVDISIDLRAMERRLLTIERKLDERPEQQAA